MQINKFKTRFSLISSGKNSEERQIHLVCRIAGNEIFYYSKFRVHPDNFIKETVRLARSTVYVQQVKNNTFNKAGDPASRINARLRELENAAQIVYDRYYKNEDAETFSRDEFKRRLQEELGELPTDVTSDQPSFFDIYTEYLNIVRVSDNRRRHIKADIKRLLEYSKETGIEITETSFDPISYKNYLRKTMSENTAVCILKRIKAFFNYSKNELRKFHSSPFDSLSFSEKIGVELYGEPVCMTRDELTILYNAKMPNDRSELCKDMFCLQAAFGCRVSDFVRLTNENIQNGQLSYFPSKTSEFANKVIVPLSNRAKEIILKYKGISPKGLLMPFLNPVHYNETLKDIFKIAGLNRTVILYNRDQRKEEFHKLYELASSHLARRTFVDILCQAGEPIHVVASMSGHSENSKAFDRYRRRPEQLQKDAVNRSMD